MDKKVLIVEDDSFLQGLASSKLEKEGFHVTSASSSEEATKALDESTPDIILLDLVLPGTDGFSILKKLREGIKTKETPVIVFSNLSEVADVTKAKEAGATEYMVKSNFTLDELAEKIKEILA